jgi:hypothetical protein
MPSPMANLWFGSQQDSGCKKFQNHRIINDLVYERTPELLAFQLKPLCGQRRPMNRLRCYMASFRSH